MDPFPLLDRARDQQLSDTGLRILLSVSNGITSQTQIAATARLSRAAINTTVKSLVTRELISKSRQGIDERQVILQLTQTGKDMVTALTAPELESSLKTEH